VIKYEDAGERIAGSPRSSLEMAFVAGMRPCKHCGVRSDLPWSSWRLDDGTVWRTDARCAGCGKERAYLFRSELDLPSIEPPIYELGGPEPSTVMSADELVREIQRVGSAVVAPMRVPAAQHDAAWKRLEHALTAVNELAKFLDGDTIPTLSTDARGQYDRRWIERERARLVALEDEK
jgi:hypothetical protein